MRFFNPPASFRPSNLAATLGYLVHPSSASFAGIVEIEKVTLAKWKPSREDGTGRKRSFVPRLFLSSPLLRFHRYCLGEKINENSLWTIGNDARARLHGDRVSRFASGTLPVFTRVVGIGGQQTDQFRDSAYRDAADVRRVWRLLPGAEVLNARYVSAGCWIAAFRETSQANAVGYSLRVYSHPCTIID